LVALIRLIQFFRLQSFKLVVSVAPKAGLLSMLAAFFTGVPNRIHIFQGEVWASKRGIQRFILKFADKLTATLATQLLAVSHSEKLFLIEQGICPREKINVLNHGSIGGVNLERYQFDAKTRVTIRDKLCIPLEAVVVIFVGRMNPDKGIYDLANAFRRASLSCDSLWLLCVGPDEGQVMPNFFKVLGEVITKTRVIGFVDNPQDYMMAADFMCLPSYREGFPVVVLEAAALALPTVGYKIYGVSDAVSDGSTGMLVDVANVEGLSRSLQYLADNSAFRRKLGSDAQKRIKSHFSSETVVASYINHFSDILE
jgi:glycosyltransferase involved in cell wall biosynthesis